MRETVKILKSTTITILTLLCSSCNKERSGGLLESNLVKLKVQNIEMEAEFTKSAYQSGNSCYIVITDNESCDNYYSKSPIIGVADEMGNIVPQNEIWLTNGYYDIYLVSNNTPHLDNLYFNRGAINNLQNGEDYLWASKKGELVNCNKDIVLTFKRMCSKVKLKLELSGSSGNDQIKSIYFTLPPTGIQFINLTNGVIEPYLGEGTLTEIIGMGEERQFITLPKEGESRIIVEVESMTGGEIIKSTQYETACNISFNAGYFYTLTLSLNIEEDKLQIISIKKSQWRVVNNEYIFSTSKEKSKCQEL